MQEPKPPVSNKLVMPEGVSSTGPYADMTEAYMKSIVAVPAMLAAMTEVLEDINDSLYVLAIYLEKKGLAEGTISNDDLERDDDGQDKTA